MDTVGAYEAKTHLPALLERVRGGDRVTITKHGHPIAHLVPVNGAMHSAVETIAALRAARLEATLGDEDLRGLIATGRRG